VCHQTAALSGSIVIVIGGLDAHAHTHTHARAHTHTCHTQDAGLPEALEVLSSLRGTFDNTTPNTAQAIKAGNVGVI